VLHGAAGRRRGQTRIVYGASDKTGAYPAENLVRPDDLSATVYALLGIDPHTEVYDTGKRPLAITGGNPITGILA